MEESSTRRRFLRGAASAVPAAALAPGEARGAAHAPESQDRRVLAGPPDRPFSRAVVFDRTVHVSGAIGRDARTGELPADFAAQCRNVFEQLEEAVVAAGSSMARVLKCTCFLTDAADFASMNELFRKYFPESPPARSTVVVKELVAAGARVEIDCIAAL